MDGVQILNTIEIQQNSPIADLGVMLLILGAFLALIAIGCNERKMLIMFSIIALVGLILLCYIGRTEIKTKTRYETIIDKSVSYIELTEKFKVIEQRGDIWVLEEKELNETSLLSGGEGK